MGAGIAKVDEKSVTKVLGNVAFMPVDHFRAGLLIVLTTSRKSSGSSRADNAVEPTKSQNITVSCRRSADRVLGARSLGVWMELGTLNVKLTTAPIRNSDLALRRPTPRPCSLRRVRPVERR